MTKKKVAEDGADEKKAATAEKAAKTTKAAESKTATAKKAAKKTETKKATPKKAAAKKAPAKKSKKAAEAEARIKLYWGVFSPTMKRVAVFHFHEKKQAAKKAKELSEGKEGKNTPHFIAKIKEAIDEKA